MIYAGRMTLSARNDFFKGGITLSAVSLVLIAAGGYFAFPAYPEAAAAAAMRSRGLLQIIIENRVQASAFIPFYSMLGASVYSLISIIIIYHFFEKTQCPEIFFFGLFVVSLSFEFVRLLLPLKNIYPYPSVYLVTSSRLLLFGRYFGLFSIFAAAVYSAGLDVQRQQSVFFILVLSSLIIALNVPVDSLVWDSSLKVYSGYDKMFAMLEGGILAVTMLTFFVSAHTRGSRTYVSIGIGAFVVLAGRDILLCSDTWITVIPGLLMLALGTWYICTRLHREYLWI